MTQEDHRESQTGPSPSATSATGMPSAQHAEAGSSRLPEGWAAAALVFFTFLALLPVLRAEMIWDDRRMIFENAVIYADEGLKDIWFSTKLPDYWPLTSTTFYLEWRLWGNNPTGYHLVNLLLHSLSAVLIWRVLRRLSVPGAWVAALAFALHPVSVTSVAWIAERKNTLSMVLLLLAILAYLRLEERRRWLWYLGALIMFLLALLAKASVVMMPVLMLVLSWWKRRKLCWQDVRNVLPFLMLSLVFGLVTYYVQQRNLTNIGQVLPMGIADRVAASAWCVWFYLYKDLLPLGLCMIYPRWSVQAASVVAWLPLVAFFILAAVTWHYRQGWGRSVGVALACFVILLLPVLGFAQMSFHAHSYVADHLQYVAVIVPVALIVASLTIASRRYGLGVWPPRVAAGIVLFLLAALSWQRAKAFESDMTIWTDTVQKNPDAWVAHHNLGALYQKQEKLDLALDHYRTLLCIDPNNVSAHNSVGSLYRMKGQTAEAGQHYHLAIKIAPDFADAYYNLGLLNQQQNNLESAVQHYLEAVSRRPDHVDAHNNLGVILRKLDRLDEAFHHLREAQRITPTNPVIYNNLGNALRQNGQVAEAITEYREALRLQPGYAEAHFSLAQTLAKAGETDRAIVHYRQAIRLKPRWPHPMNSLAWLLVHDPGLPQHQPEEAIQLAQHAVALTRKQHPPMLKTLAEAYAAAGKFELAVKAAEAALALFSGQAENPQSKELREQIAQYKERVERPKSQKVEEPEGTR